MRMPLPHCGHSRRLVRVSAARKSRQSAGWGSNREAAVASSWRQRASLAVAVAVGQEAVVADALEAGRNDVLEEAADELLGGDGHHLGFAGVAVILPLEGDLAVFQGQQAPVGDGHAVGVAAEILQHVLRSAKGGLGVDHPFLVLERRQVAGKSGRVARAAARSPKNWSSPAA